MAQTISNFKDMILLATSRQEGTRFEKSVVYVCSHSEEGAMGVVVNRPMKKISFGQILQTMGLSREVEGHVEPMPSKAGTPAGIPKAPRRHEPIIFNGGPVEPARGFVVHSSDYKNKATVRVGGDVSLSATSDIISAIAGGRGPGQMNFCLGYAGWGPHQLEDEIADDSWVVAPSDERILFELKPQDRYMAAMDKLGLNFEHGYYGQECGVA